MHQQPPLPYSLDALEPYLSARTLQYHYEKHHAGYFSKLNSLIEHTPFAAQSLEDTIRSSQGAIYNNAAQAWNHIIYWDCMSPVTQEPQGHARAAIERDFGSCAQFQDKFTQAALNTFGSGWAWLILNNDNRLEILSTSNADNPLTHEFSLCLLACDVWEHAYYLDTQNDRGRYLEHFWKVCRWQRINEQLDTL
tara:strand:+ start:313 stop:894 length:582 start_codon:yes stop_codon:yes gene_type:complete